MISKYMFLLATLSFVCTCYIYIQTPGITIVDAAFSLPMSLIN